MSDERIPHRRRWVGATVALLLTGILIALGWVTVRGIGAINELNRLNDETEAFEEAIASSELERLQPITDRIVAHAASAQSLTSDPVWRTFELVPWLGTNMTALREVAALTNTAAKGAVEPLAEAAAELALSDLGLTARPVDLVAFEKARVPLAAAAGVLSDATAQAERIVTGSALTTLADAVQGAQSALHEASASVGALHAASVLLPTMLGSEAPRQYLVAMHNNESAQSVGAFSLVRTHGGTTTVVRTVPAAEFAEFAALTTSADFAQAAAPLAVAWQQRFSEAVDGVFAIDTQAAASLLKATGAITVGDYAIDSDNVVDALLSPQYLELADAAQHQQVFAAVAENVVLSALAATPSDVIAALAHAGDTHHIRAWSAHEDEQRMLAPSTLNRAQEKSD